MFVVRISKCLGLVGLLQISPVLASSKFCTLSGASPQPSAASPIDVFLVAGQSNATGRPDDATGSPRVPSGKVLQYYRAKISDANDPVGDALPGSAWPEFGRTYYQMTGRRILLVPVSVTASAMSPAADFFKRGHWDASGALFDASVQQTDEALQSAGPSARFAGVLWDQGENDALAINAGSETANDYHHLLSDLISRYRRRFGPSTPFFIFESGATTDKNQQGMVAVRSVQVEVSAEDSQTPIVFKDAATFIARGLMAKNGSHYSQAGYNEMGHKGALKVADFLSARFKLQCP